MTSRYQEGFLAACSEMGMPEPLASSLLKMAEDQELQRASEIFKDWLTHRGYSVRNGETLGGIAARLNVPLQTLMEENGLASPTQIRPGQTLRIPMVQAKK